MKTDAYLRVSTDAQGLNAQKLAILEFARKENIHMNDFIETTGSHGVINSAKNCDPLWPV
jgi:DNA invertase Pin-like site-specific DNA recombinase